MTDAAPPPPPPPARSEGLDPKALAIGVYALYLASYLTGVTAIAGVVIAYIARKDGPDWLQSHFEFQIRTFWLGLAGAAGGLLLIPVLGLGFLVWIAVALWFLVRSVIGLSYVLKDSPYPNPKGWLI